MQKCRSLLSVTVLFVTVLFDEENTGILAGPVGIAAHPMPETHAN